MQVLNIGALSDDELREAMVRNMADTGSTPVIVKQIRKYYSLLNREQLLAKCEEKCGGVLYGDDDTNMGPWDIKPVPGTREQLRKKGRAIDIVLGTGPSIESRLLQIKGVTWQRIGDRRYVNCKEAQIEQVRSASLYVGIIRL